VGRVCHDCIAQDPGSSSWKAGSSSEPAISIRLSAWPVGVRTLQSGASRQTVAAAILSSLESDRLEAQSPYMQFLHGAADSSGLDVFTNALQRGLSNEQIGVILLSSAEYFARI